MLKEDKRAAIIQIDHEILASFLKLPHGTKIEAMRVNYEFLPPVLDVIVSGHPQLPLVQYGLRLTILRPEYTDDQYGRPYMVRWHPSYPLI